MKNEDDASDSDAGKVAETPPKKPLSRRRKRRLIIASIVILTALLIIFWGWSETGNRSYLSVGQILADADSIASNTSQYCNIVIEIQGIVSEWNGTSQAFVLADKVNASATIRVNMIAILPDGFGIGKTVVVRGRLLNELPITLVADGITVGCSSKY